MSLSINHFTTVINSKSQLVIVLNTVSHLRPSLLFVVKLEPTQVEPTFCKQQYMVKVTVTNNLAYYETELLTTVKIFIIQTPEEN
jgi:hypothetical protein